MNPNFTDRIPGEKDRYSARFWQEGDAWFTQVTGDYGNYDSGKHGPYLTHDRARMTAYALALEAEAR